MSWTIFFGKGAYDMPITFILKNILDSLLSPKIFIYQFQADGPCLYCLCLIYKILKCESFGGREDVNCNAKLCYLKMK